MLWRLVWRNFGNDRLRLVSAIAGVAGAVALVCWHVGLAMTALHAGDAAARKAAAPFAAWITGPADGLARVRPPEGGADGGRRAGGKSGSRIAGDAPKGRAMPQGRRAPVRATPIPPPFLDSLAAADGVEDVVRMRIAAATLDVRPGGHVLQGPPLRAFATLLPEGGIPFAIGGIEGRLPAMDSPVPEVAVCGSVFGTRVPAPGIGEPLPMTLSGGTAAPVIVGYFRMSGMIRLFPSVYCNAAAMSAIEAVAPDFPRTANLALVRTADGTSLAVAKALASAPAGRATCRVETVEEAAGRFRGDSVGNLISSLPLSLALAVVTSACLAATVMLIGLALRRRLIAELRCAGMTCGGVAGLVFGEAAAISFFGWLAGFALSAAALAAFLFAERGGDLPARPFLGWQTPVAGLALAAVVGIFAAVVPAVAAMRVKPLEALGRNVALVKRFSWRRTALALALFLPMPAVSVCPGLGDTGKAIAMAAFGFPCFVAALILSLHPLMRLAEALFLRPVSRMLALDPAILRGRLAGDPSRAAGTVVSLALGLGAFIAIHVWGGTLMASFVPSGEWPDAIVSILPNGWTDAQVAVASRAPGIEGGRLIKIDCTQKPFDSDSPAFAGRVESIPNGQVLVFGADPDAAFGGEHPFAPFAFVSGDRDVAIAAMREGRGCVMVSMLARLAGLSLGDRIRLAGRELEISGIVDLNWHMVTSRALVRTPFGREGMRTGDGTPPGRTIGMVFAGEQFVRGITGNAETYFLWLDATPELDALGGLRATVALDDALRAAVPPDGASAIQVHHRDEIADGTLAHGNDILGMMARIPFWSLAVASTGIVALLLAAVQGSLGELRTMRAVGMTRGQLARMLIGEALLVALAAMLLGFVAGLASGWSFTGLSRWMASAGLPVRLVVPWGRIAEGAAFMVALCLAMSLPPLSRLVRMVGVAPVDLD